jgi:hypothetical protein
LRCLRQRRRDIRTFGVRSGDVTAEKILLSQVIDRRVVKDNTTIVRSGTRELPLLSSEWPWQFNALLVPRLSQRHSQLILLPSCRCRACMTGPNPAFPETGVRQTENADGTCPAWTVQCAKIYLFWISCIDRLQGTQNRVFRNSSRLKTKDMFTYSGLQFFIHP